MSTMTLSSGTASFYACAFGSSSTTVKVIVGSSDGTINVSESTSAEFSFTALDDKAVGPIRDICLAGTTFVCVGDGGSITTVSSDGGNIVTARESSTSDSLMGCAYDAATGNVVAVGYNGTIVKSTDNGVTWSNVPVGETTHFMSVASNGNGSLYAVGFGGIGYLSTDGGVTWSDVGTGQTDNIYDVCGDSSNWVFCGINGYIAKADASCTTFTEITSPVSVNLMVALNNSLLLGSSGSVVSLDGSLSTATDLTNSAIADNFYDGDYNSDLGGYLALSHLRLLISNTSTAVPDWGTFTPISDTYRANDYIVLNGYVILIGTSEYDSDEGKYLYHSRRLRWTAPNTIADFTGVGSGVGDLNGRGQLLFGEVVNDRGILFESESISALLYTGIVADPWKYEKIKEGLWSISNPVIADDNLYFVGSDGLIYATNGITVDEIGSPFDMTEFNDFDYTRPVVLQYSSEAGALLVFRPSSPYELHVIKTAGGEYSQFELPTFETASHTYVPKTIVARNDNYLSQVMVSYVRSDGAADDLQTIAINFGEQYITGIDEMTLSSTAYHDYYYMVIDTGNLFIQDEGRKTSIKHFVIRTYTDGSTTGVIGVQTKGLADTSWHDEGDPYATITVTNSDCTLTGSAVSNLLDGANGTKTVFETPCLATQARIYVYDGSNYVKQVLGTDYTITDTKEITMDSAPAIDSLYCYWDNEPYIRIGIGDIISTTDGMHIVIGTPDWKTLTLDRYMTSGSDVDAKHIPAENIPSGEGSIQLGMNKLVEGTQMRVIIVPRSSSDSKVLKVTGISIGHIDTRGQKDVS